MSDNREDGRTIRVYTPGQLAARWKCTDRHVRKLIMSGELKAFRLGGKLLRITAEAVEAFECPITDWDDTGGDTSSPGMTTMELATATRLARLTARRRRNS